MTQIKIDKSKEIEFHEKLKKYAMYSYHDNKKELLEGAKQLNSYHMKSGLDAYVLQKDNDIVVAFRGTQQYNEDLNDGAEILFNKVPKQAKEAYEICKEIKANYQGYDITVTGHSLGGGIGAYAAARNGLQAVVFNPIGTAGLIKTDENIDTSRIINYCNPRDWVASGNANEHFGKCYEINSKGFASQKAKGLFAHHDIEVMEDLRTRTPVTKSELMHKYNNYESSLPPYLDTAIKAFRDTFNVHTHSSNCAGTYSVGGYTRGDGTKVSSYERTCGAHH